MNVGLFALMAGFLLPLALVIRVGALRVAERRRGWAHPLNLLLTIEALLAVVPVISLFPSVFLLVAGRSIEEGALLLDFAGTRWGLFKLSVNVAGVLMADASLPRLTEQLTRDPPSTEAPTRSYIVRDLGVLVVCLLLASFAAVHR